MVSTTDPECGLFHKGEHEKQFAYSVHTACDTHGFVLGLDVSPGNIHDSVLFFDLYEQIIGKFPQVRYIVADAKQKHNMRYTTLKGKLKMKRTALLIFAAMNLKKLTNWMEKTFKTEGFFSYFCLKIIFVENLC